MTRQPYQPELRSIPLTIYDCPDRECCTDDTENWDPETPRCMCEGIMWDTYCQTMIEFEGCPRGFP